MSIDNDSYYTFRRKVLTSVTQSKEITMNEKNQKMLELLSSILMVDIDILVDRIISKYIDNLPHKNFNELEERLFMLKQEEVNTWVASQLEE